MFGLNKKIRYKRFGKKNAGFSLLECVMALLLVMIAGIALTSVFFFSSRNSFNARNRLLALRLAEQRVEDLRTKSFSLLTAGTTTEYGVVFEGQKFNVQLKVTDNDLLTTSNAPGAETKLITYTVTPINNSLIGEGVTLTAIRAVTRPGPYREPNTP